MNKEILTKEIENTYNEVVNWRRHLHQYPELSFKEHKTAEYIAKQLNKFGNIEVSHPTETSVMGRLRGKNGAGKTIAFRADIDALPIQEETNLPFASKVSGIMHACGHDGHTAILLGTAKVLSKLQDKLKGEFVFLFQHAEEVPPGGAREMVEAGVLDGVDFVLGLHLFSNVPFGEIQITDGPLTAASDIFDIKIEGTSGHASQPDTAIDAIAIASQIVTNLQHITSRVLSPLESGVVSVTRFHSGDAYNVIPEIAEIGGSVRASTNEVREKIKESIERICTNIATAHNAKANLTYQYGYDPIINNKYLSKAITNHVKNYFKNDPRIHIVKAKPMLVGEDFSAFSNVVPGCYVFIGASKRNIEDIYPHHHPKFDFDEEALEIALQYYVSTAIYLTEEDNLSIN